MPNIRLVVEYDGSKFFGWQKQPKVRTVQEELARVLEIALREKVRSLHAAGRTDAGVHARGQVVCFKTNAEVDLHRLSHSVSSLLKNELSIISAEIVPDSFHACRDATSKQYSYTIINRLSPPVLERGRVWHIGRHLDIKRMKEEAAALIGKHDFKCFKGSGCSIKNNNKEIYQSELVKKGDLLIYRVVGDGFLKQMVRNIVGTLVGFGKDNLKIGSMQELINSRDRRQAGVTAPPYGLTLDWVKYER